MKRRFYALMLVVAMIAMTLVACGSDTNDTTNTTNDATVNTEIEESGETVVPETPVEDPVETPEVEEPVVEAEPTPDGDVNGESETINYEYAHDFTFPEGMNGFTKKYLNETVPEWSLNETHYVDTNGNEMNFEWEGFATLGENAGVTSGSTTLMLSDSEMNYILRAWNGGELKVEELDECLALDKDVWTTLSATDIIYPENGYYNIERVDNVVYVTYAVKTDTMQGYSYFICNGDVGNYYMFTYLEKNEIYNDARAMCVINSIEYWDYISEETTIE